jgi:DNA-binding transcriptional LysR family regulator
MSTTGRLSVELLEAFVAVVHTGSVTNAGLMLHRAQPCISTQLKRLEHRVGKPLFERNSKPLRLTPTGLVLLENAERILDCYETARLNLRAPDLGEGIKIGLPEWFANEAFEAVLADYGTQFPGAGLNITIADSQTLHALHSSGRLDMVIALPGRDRKVPDDTVEEPLLWVTGHCDPSTDPLPLVIFEEPCMFRRPVFERLEAAGRNWHERFVTTSVATAKLAVSSGIGVAALPESAVSERFRVLGREDGFAELPPVKLGIYMSSRQKSEIVNFLGPRLSQFLRQSVAFGKKAEAV